MYLHINDGLVGRIKYNFNGRRTNYSLRPNLALDIPIDLDSLIEVAEISGNDLTSRIDQEWEELLEEYDINPMDF